MSLLGIDIGSSSCKGVVFDVLGKVLASQTQKYFPEKIGSSMVEIEASIFREAVFNMIRHLSELVQENPIEALAISSHGETTIALDKYGNPTCRAIMNSDNRATEIAEWWDDTFGTEEIYKITGLPLHAMFSLNKILWIRKYEGHIYAKTDRFLSVGDYILTQMGLPPYTDYSLASRTMAFDISKQCWSESILKHCNLSEDKLGIPLASGSIAGRLSKGIARKLGLKEGTAVALGGHDQPCGALGAGAIHSGNISDSAGTYECMAAVTEMAMNSRKALRYSLNSYCHVVPDRFVTLAFFPAGIVSSWFVEQFCSEDQIISKIREKDLFDVLNDNTMKLCPDPTGLIVTPHFVGSGTPYWDARATGAMVGLTPGISRYHIYKAIYEGLACELAINIKALEEVVGAFGKLTITGGNSRSPFTVQLRADITGKEIHLLKNEEAVCLGAAILAGISIGIYKDAADAVNQVIQIEKTVFPNAKTAVVYKKQIEKYNIVYKSLDQYRNI